MQLTFRENLFGYKMVWIHRQPVFAVKSYECLQLLILDADNVVIVIFIATSSCQELEKLYSIMDSEMRKFHLCELNKGFEIPRISTNWTGIQKRLESLTTNSNNSSNKSVFNKTIWSGVNFEKPECTYE